MRTEDVRQLLEEGAAQPSRRVDVGAVLSQGRRLQRRRAIAFAALGAAAVVGAAVVAANLDGFDRSRDERARPQPPASLPAGWTELALPPEVRGGASLVWTGSELLAWGGCSTASNNECVGTADGYSFDLATQSWEPFEQAPRTAANADGVWTGTEAIFVEGDGGRLGGQAYNPASGTWRTIAPAPIAARSGAVVVWTGSEVIVSGGGAPNSSTPVSGAAYDPANDTWRPIADAPHGLNNASGVWTGNEMLVFGSLLGDRNIADTRTSVGAAYDPVADTWREIPPSELSPQATSAVWVGERMVAWDYEVHSQEYDPAGDRWSEPIEMPFGFDECYPDSEIVKDLVFGFFCGRAALYDAAADRWTQVHGGLLDDEVRSEAYGRSLKLWRFADIVSTGDAVLLLAEGITLSETGEACYGCAGSPQSFWAFRPTE
jgi:hypothetical protein